MKGAALCLLCLTCSAVLRAQLTFGELISLLAKDTVELKSYLFEKNFLLLSSEPYSDCQNDYVIHQFSLKKKASVSNGVTLVTVRDCSSYKTVSQETNSTLSVEKMKRDAINAGFHFHSSSTCEGTKTLRYDSKLYVMHIYTETNAKGRKIYGLTLEKMR